MKYTIIKALLLCSLILSGCSTYRSNKYTTGTFKNYQEEKNGLSVGFDPIVDTEKSEWYLNLKPAKYDLLPIFITVINKSDSIKKIDVDDSHLTNNLKQGKYESLGIEKAVKMLQASGWIPSLLFGLPGSIAAGEMEKEKDNDFCRKAFSPRILNPGSRGEGIVFFDVPKEEILNNKFILCLAVEDLDSNSSDEFLFPFETGSINEE